MSELVGKMQGHLKKTSTDLILFTAKLASGAVLGLTFALITQVLLGHAEGENMLAFLFVIAITIGAFLRIAKPWGMTTLLVFDLVCVLVGMVLRLYIMVAPDQ